MKKKILLSLITTVVVVAGVAAFSGFEAHIINVTAHIENALSVDTTPIDFGTVFPQEYVEEEFTISLSDSFLGQSRVHEVDYIIVQKPKPIWPQTLDCKESHLGIDFENINEARAYCHEYPENLECCYLSLCPFLSKINEEIDEDEGAEENDTDALSYYVEAVGAPDYCITPGEASGRLTKYYQDTEDRWVVDLKVPPVKGYVGQDWPASCAEWVVEQDSQDYGCDLWIEVIGIHNSNGNDECIPTAEVCNGIDDDCDTLIDEGPLWVNKGDSCSVGIGACESQGVYICDSGNQAGPTICSAVAGTPTTEICDDDIDNDCDGYMDCADIDCIGDDVCIITECTSGDTRYCYTGDPVTRNEGLCQDGIETCVEGFWSSVCVGDITPVAEVCDGLDNDCDGEVDEGVCAPVNGWTYEQNFNSLSDGNLSGQDGWVANAEADVQTSEKYEGAKGLQIYTPSGEKKGYRSITGTNEGIVYIAVRKNNISNTSLAIYLSYNNRATDLMAVVLATDGNINLYYGTEGWTTQILYESYDADQWYVVAIEWNDATNPDQYRAKVHDGTSWGAWTDWKATFAALGEVNTITLAVNYENGAGIGYFDTITPTDPTQ